MAQVAEARHAHAPSCSGVWSHGGLTGQVFASCPPPTAKLDGPLLGLRGAFLGLLLGVADGKAFDSAKGTSPAHAERTQSDETPRAPAWDRYKYEGFGTVLVSVYLGPRSLASAHEGADLRAARFLRRPPGTAGFLQAGRVPSWPADRFHQAGKVCSREWFIGGPDFSPLVWLAWGTHCEWNGFEGCSVEGSLRPARILTFVPLRFSDDHPVSCQQPHDLGSTAASTLVDSELCELDSAPSDSVCKLLDGSIVLPGALQQCHSSLHECRDVFLDGK